MPKKKFKKIPDRWEDYTNIGAQVAGTKFIAFKVPLYDHEDWNLEELKKAVPDLKHIIDLTNTNRYYSPSLCNQYGWRHRKIFVPGHVVPAKQYVKQFFAAVAEAGEADDGLIGVHCTHGLNRTGYMVCRYMIEQQGTEPDQAILAFDTARGHKQERENYLDHLKTKAWETETEPSSGPSKPDRSHYQQQTRTYHNSWYSDKQWRQPSHHDNWRQGHQRQYHDYERGYQRQYPDHERGSYRDDQYRYRGASQYGRYNSYDGGYQYQGYNDYSDRGWGRYGSHNYHGNKSRRENNRRRDGYGSRDSHHTGHRGSTSSNSDSQSKSSE